MTLEVRIGSGTGVELLLAAAAVADADWRQVFTHGPAAHQAVRRADPALVGDARRLGRYAFLHLLGPLTTTRTGWSHDRLTTVVERMPADDLRWTLAGGRRRQLSGRIGEDRVRAALGGDRTAARELRSALADSLLQVSPWLLRTSDEEVRDTCLRVLDGLAVLDRRAPSTAATRAALDDLGPERLLTLVAPGVTYGPGALDEVVLATSIRAAPILVAVDETDRTVIVHPPLADGGATDSTSRLRDIGRALGDDTRIRVLQQLREGDRTLSGLCAALGSPRTTLLHHLALLRSAGLVNLRVGPGTEPNVYALADDGFESLALAARAFTAR